MVFAMLMVDGCGMTRMCSYLCELLGQAMNTLRQKYREIQISREKISHDHNIAAIETLGAIRGYEHFSVDVPIRSENWPKV